MQDGFFKIACATPRVKVADTVFNCQEAISYTKQAFENNANIIIFPELNITSYTCSDLFFQRTLIESSKKSLFTFLESTFSFDIISVIGMPIEYFNNLYNCAVVCYKGKVLGVVPKQNIPNYNEFYEIRHFSSGKDLEESIQLIDIKYNEKSVSAPFGANMVFSCKNIPLLTFGIEICEDVWIGNTPSIKMAQNGANLILNLSCSNEVIGKEEYRRTLLKAKSGSLNCAYAYANAGFGESTQDLVFSGHSMILENGSIISESELFKNDIIYGDVDLQRISHDRHVSNTYQSKLDPANIVPFEMELRETKINRFISPTPFIPHVENEFQSRMDKILIMQASGLATRLAHIGCKNVVIGLSGGLDSTLALIVSIHAFQLLNLDVNGIKAITMPCFGTTDRTYQNACELAKNYGAELIEIRINKSVTQHLEDIQHDISIHDVTYENAQARERTQVLMDLSNQVNGIVIGTGDLSELALGWATYNGDHMSMYAVNASIPKTLVRHLVNFEANRSNEKISSILKDILDTPVSPELLPPTDNGKISQKTEDLVGPYKLHDFYLYYVLRYGFSPSKIFRLAKIAFENEYDDQTIYKWLEKFYYRFFSQQFKRSCLPDGPKIGSICLSPRGDWRMPSDASYRIWIEELQSIHPNK